MTDEELKEAKETLSQDDELTKKWSLEDELDKEFIPDKKDFHEDISVNDESYSSVPFYRRQISSENDNRQLDVYEAFQERMAYIVQNYDVIIVSFSGGKDSGVLLNLVLKYIEDNHLDIKPLVMHQDVEAQYSATTDYVTRTYKTLTEQDKIIPYWCCQSISLGCSTSVHQYCWYPWNPDEKDIWVRDMPDFPVKTNDNFNFPGFYFGIEYHKHFEVFERYIASINPGKKVICLSGIRTQESLNRYRAVHNKVHADNNIPWTMKIDENITEAYPIFDFTVEDVWIANAMFNFDYNKIYDKMYLAGATISQMRVASPFHDAAQTTLAMFKIIEPQIWDKLIHRVQGAEYTAKYANTKLFGKNLKNPPNNLGWRQFTRFLLRTYPPKTREHYTSKFMTSIIFWHTVGGSLDEETIQQLRDKGYNIALNGVSPYSRQKKQRVIFKGLIPEETDDIKCKDVPSWKRMCKCLLKNDFACISMGFGITAQQEKMLDAIRGKIVKK